jgi:flagellin
MSTTTGIADADIVLSKSNATSTTGINDLSVLTTEDSWLAIKQIDDSLDQVNSARATLGAVQSRFENAVSNIQIQTENTAAARGRIIDADFAAETANLSKAQILQQAGTAMVAQANQLPQQVLTLLR